MGGRQETVFILNPLSIGYISGQAKGKRQKAKERIDNQFLITGFSIRSRSSGDDFYLGLAE
jgi:hypothetical protein